LAVSVSNWTVIESVETEPLTVPVTATFRFDTPDAENTIFPDTAPAVAELATLPYIVLGLPVEKVRGPAEKEVLSALSSSGLKPVMVTFPVIFANVTTIDCELPAVPAVAFMPVKEVGDTDNDGAGLTVADTEMVFALAPVAVTLIVPL